MISGATEEELIIANARAEVLTKCGKDILNILDNQNEKYEKQLEDAIKDLNNQNDRLNNIINTSLEYIPILRQLIQDNPPALTSLKVLEDKLKDK